MFGIVGESGSAQILIKGSNLKSNLMPLSWNWYSFHIDSSLISVSNPWRAFLSWHCVRPRENFRGFSAQWFLKNLGQFLSALAISGPSDKISPCPIRSEVGRPRGLFKAIWHPTSERISPGENLSEWPEIARALTNWPKFYKNHCAENPWKFSRGLPTHQTPPRIRVYP